MKAILQHLRIPFSLLLLPVFLYALISAPHLLYLNTTWLLFFILHILVYPSSNAFNSLQDKDEGSIGMIEKPLPVPRSIRWISIGMDFIALLFCLLINYHTLILLLAYIIASRLYSWRAVRLKQYPILAFFIVFIFQGAAIYFIVLASNGEHSITQLTCTKQHFMGAIACSCLIGSGYPLSQIYQHQQDAKDGIKTISMLLGYIGTFIFSGILFLIAGIIFYLNFKNNNKELFLFFASANIVGIYFIYWFTKVRKATFNANYKSAMRMNVLSCITFNICFIIILILRAIH